ncbi:MAG: CvpA family protein [Bryobacterales bacterium]|nr:CvpA family protein [Bryobacterales bacterium]
MTLSGFNWLDLVFLSIFAGSVVNGLLRGFARTILGFASTVAAIVAAIWFYGRAGRLLRPYVSHDRLADFAGFLIVFLGVILIGVIASRILDRLIKWMGLKWLDRLMGAGLGALRAALVAAAIVMGMCSFSRNPPPMVVAQSALSPYLLEMAKVMMALAPPEMRQVFNESYGKVKKLWQDVVNKVPERV